MEYQSSSSQTKDECGSTFGNKMLTMSYQSSKGWSSPIIKDYAPITISPSAQCLHYGQTVLKIWSPIKSMTIFISLNLSNTLKSSINH